MSIYTKLMAIQANVKVPKNQYNAFGKYKYRSGEDILEGVKPILQTYECALQMQDEVINIEGRFYVKATTILIDCETSETVMSSAFAREEETKKGMDGAQVTGAASSYARKYALNGLFCLDDVKDPDHDNKGNGNGESKLETLKRLAKEGGYSAEQMKEKIGKHGVEKSTELTEKQLNDLINEIREEMKNE